MTSPNTYTLGTQLYFIKVAKVFVVNWFSFDPQIMWDSQMHTIYLVVAKINADWQLNSRWQPTTENIYRNADLFQPINQFKWKELTSGKTMEID